MYAVEVEHPLNGWTRLASRYSTKAMAQSWLPFIRKAWHGLPLRIVEVQVVQVQKEKTK